MQGGREEESHKMSELGRKEGDSHPFLLNYQQTVAASRDSSTTTFGGKTRITLPHFGIADVFAVVCVVLLSPWLVFLFVYLGVLLLPSLLVIKVYALSLGRPVQRVYRGVIFNVVSIILLILNLPVIPVLLFHFFFIFTSSWLVAIPFGLFVLGPTQIIKNLTFLWPFMSTGSWYWGDCVIAVLGIQDKHSSFFLFYRSYLEGLVIQPVLKYFMVTNPFLHVLDTRYCNQWTPVLDADYDTLYNSVFTLTSEAKTSEQWRQELQNDEFSAHYQTPPPDRAITTVPLSQTCGPQVLGYQFVKTLSLRVHTIFPVKDKYKARSQIAHYNALTVVLYYFNPLHFLTGVVEVNVRQDHRLEHPMWCVHGTNYWAVSFFNNVNDLFLRFGYQVADDLYGCEGIANQGIEGEQKLTSIVSPRTRASPSPNLAVSPRARASTCGTADILPRPTNVGHEKGGMPIVFLEGTAPPPTVGFTLTKTPSARATLDEAGQLHESLSSTVSTSTRASAEARTRAVRATTLSHVHTSRLDSSLARPTVPPSIARVV